MNENNYINDEGIDLSDIPEITDFSRLRKIPSNYAERMKKGYSININFQSMEEINEYIVSGKANRMLADKNLKSLSLTLNKLTLNQDERTEAYLKTSFAFSPEYVTT